MLGLGLASSHAPAIFCSKEVWPKAYRTNMPDYMLNSPPHTAALETPEVIDGYIKRINAAFDALRAQIEAYKPGLDPTGSTPEEFAAEVKRDIQRFGGLVKALNLHAE